MVWQMLMRLDVLGMLSALNEGLISLSERLNLPPTVLLVTAAVWALVVGLFGTYLSNVLTSVTMGILGYCFGVELFRWIFSTKIFLGLGFFLVYTVGVIFAALFFFLGWKKSRLVIAFLFAFIGYAAIHTYAPGGTVFLALGVALLCGILVYWTVKPVFCAFTGAVGGLIIVSSLGTMMPKLGFLQLTAGSTAALWIAGILSLVFFTVQIITTWRYKMPH